MMLVFNWQYPDGKVENWWASPGSPRCSVAGSYTHVGTYHSTPKPGRRFVYNAFKAGYAIAINLDARAIQVTRFSTNERVETLFTAIEDTTLADAMDVVAEADDADVMFLVTMYLRYTDRDDLAAEIEAGATQDIPVVEP